MPHRIAPLAFGLVAAGAVLLVAPSAGPARQAKAPPKTPPLPAGTTAHPDLAYGPNGDRNALDLYVPKGDGPFPLLVWVHGGAWRGGSKAGGNPALRYLARGYAVASVEYRFSQHAVFPAQIEDCKAAVRFLRANAAKYKLDPDRFGAWGSSAGGHLVALLGTAGDVKEWEGGPNGSASSRVQAVCDFYGPTDLTKMAEQATVKGPIDHDSPTAPEALLIGGPVQANKDKAARANPITYVSKDDPPFLLVHGDQDPLVPLGQSEILRDALKKAGVPCELIVIKDGGHGGAGFDAPPVRDAVAAFFDKHLQRAK